MRKRLVFAVAFILLVTASRKGQAQDVISASSGVLQYFEGAVIVDDKTVEHKAAVFPSLKNGSIIQTVKGRAELLLTPGVFLRLDENSSLRMTSNSLADTRVEVLTGAAILDNLNASPNDGSVLVYDVSEVRFPKPGIYRIDCDLGELQVYSGEAQVKHRGVLSTVDPAHLYYFSLEFKTSKLGDGAMDEFYDWARNRSEMIADKNQLASADQNDPGDPDPGSGLGGFVPPGLYSPPNYVTITPSPGYSSYAGGLDPFYLYPATPYFGYGLFPSVLVIAPYRPHPIGSKWPVSAAGGPIITRWPRPIQGGGSYGVTTHPIVTGYRPAGTLSTRPSVTAVPRVSPMSVAPRAPVSHAGMAGHR